MTRRITFIAACLLAVLAPSRAGLADVLINEVLYTTGLVGSGDEAHAHEWVELYNNGAEDVSLFGWTLTNRDAGPVILLPPWALPAGTYLTIHLATGTNDDEFDDWDGHYYAGGPAGLFDDNEDECALYAGVPGAGTIVDFVSWSNQGGYTPGTSHDYAAAGGIWTAGDYLNTQESGLGDTIARYFDGFDRNLVADWRVLGWPIYVQSSAHQPENPIQVAPKNRSVTNDTGVTFDWSDFPGSDSYELQVDNDLDFSSPIVDVANLAASQYGPVGPLSDDVYFYRVRAVISGMTTPWAAEWSVVVSSSVPDGSSLRADPRNAPHLYQRKDTNLLCLWNPVSATRPGCPEMGACAWDAPHPNGPPDVTGCRHGWMYCVPTSIAMMNHAYGGDLNIDRVAYQMKSVDRPQPEGDLGHNLGYRPPPDPEEPNGLSWALNGAAIAVVADPTFAQIKGWVNDRGCFMARVPGHMVVIDDYFEYTTPAGTDVQIVYSQDPWNGPWYRYVYRYVIAGTPSPHWARRYSTRRFAHAFLQPVAGVTARAQEAAVTTDSDGDGVMDFDEGTPRALQCNKNKVDTDLDQVPDKNDIRSYTFHDTDHPGHNNDALTFSDWDQDGLRSENDCDSDSRDGVNGDGDFDGGEDIDGNGHNKPSVGETCMFDPNDWLLTVHVDKDTYLVGEKVFIVDNPGNRETRTFHADSIYWYEWGGGCPTKANDTPLRHDGKFDTDNGGRAHTALVTRCPRAGQYYLTVDVLGDRNYSTPDNTDPQTCWWCLRRVWDYVRTGMPNVRYGPSTWTRHGTVIGTTFPEGVIPPPGVTMSDHVDLPEEPNDWHWYVEYLCNGVLTRTYVTIVNFPEGASIKVEIVCSLGTAGMETTLFVDVGADHYSINDAMGDPIWEGVWSQYPDDIPPSLGFTLMDIERQNFPDCETCPGDTDGSNVVDINDIPAFVDELLSPAPSHCADVNGDLKIDGSDIQPMVQLVLADGGAGTPCPVETGACCNHGGPGVCEYTREEECTGPDMIWLGPGSNCDDCPCVVPCEPNEGEPICGDGYLDNYNGGCGSEPVIFQLIECGQTICGTSGTFLFQGSSYRDTDWYEITTTEYSDLYWTVEAEFAPLLTIIKTTTPGDCNVVEFLNWATGGACEDVTAEAPGAEPGTYWLWIGPNEFTGVPCGARYEATLTCAPFEPRGACCDDSIPSCEDDVLLEDCTSRFELDTLCDDLVPPCGGCPEDTFTLQLLTDNYPGETTWDVKDTGGIVVCSGGPYEAENTLYQESCCLDAAGCYTFTIYDSYGDGICCEWGEGHYVAYLNDTPVAEGGEFGSYETSTPFGGGCEVGK